MNKFVGIFIVLIVGFIVSVQMVRFDSEATRSPLFPLTHLSKPLFLFNQLLNLIFTTQKVLILWRMGLRQIFGWRIGWRQETTTHQSGASLRFCLNFMMAIGVICAWRLAYGSGQPMFLDVMSWADTLTSRISRMLESDRGRMEEWCEKISNN